MYGSFAYELTPVLAQNRGLYYIGGGLLTTIIIILLVTILLRR